LPILTKDLGLSLEMARKTEFPLPLGSVAHQIFTACSATDFGAEDDAAIIKYYQSLTGIKLPEVD
jgi:L-threonate 2-dehydrogenase